MAENPSPCRPAAGGLVGKFMHGLSLQPIARELIHSLFENFIRPPGRLFPLFPNPSAPSVHRDDTTTNSRPQPSQLLHPDSNSAPGNARQDTQGPRFHAHTFIRLTQHRSRAGTSGEGCVSRVRGPQQFTVNTMSVVKTPTSSLSGTSANHPLLFRLIVASR
jgi:hypothetical protein